MSTRAAIFCFHDVVALAELDRVALGHRPYVLTPEELRTLLRAGADTGLRSVPVGQLAEEVGGGVYALTFDDGASSDYTQVFPALRELGLRGTFFVVAGTVGKAGHVSWAQLREMVAGGMEIGSHSMTHPFLDRLDLETIAAEYRDSKTLLEDRLGVAVLTASLPRGWAPPGLGTVLHGLGYRVFCTSRVGWWRRGDDPFEMPRVGVRRGMAPEEFTAIVEGRPRALWRLRAIEAAKNFGKGWLGSESWQRLREPLLGWRHRVGGDA